MVTDLSLKWDEAYGRNRGKHIEKVNETEKQKNQSYQWFQSSLSTLFILIFREKVFRFVSTLYFL